MEKLKCKPILLESPTGVLTLGKEIQWNIPGTFRGTKFHLYLVSDEEIQVGDWFQTHVYYDVSSTPILKIGKCTKLVVDGIQGNVEEFTDAFWMPQTCKKVVATTDKSLGLPSISESFVKEYVESNGSIEEVEIEVVEVDGRLVPVQDYATDSIVISQSKETWTRDEVVDFTRKALIAYETSMVSPYKVKQYIDEKGQFDAEFWLKENLK